MNKNELYEIEITDIGNDGEGIGHIDNMAVFIKDALIGDKLVTRIVKTKKNYAYGRVERILIPSPYRVEPQCEKARSCGGCTLQHMSYEKQLEYKWNKVKGCLERIGGIKNAGDLMEEAHGMENPFHYRNKMQFPVAYDKEGRACLGFYAGHTHSLISLSDCAIGHPVNSVIIEIVKNYIDKFGVSIYNEETSTGLVRHILTRVGFSTGELMVCVIANGTKLPYSEVLTDMLRDGISKWSSDNSDNGCFKKDTKIEFKSLMLNINREKTNKILGDTSKVLWGQSYITDYIGDVRFHISPQSFYQVNPLQTKRLYEKALEYANLSGMETVWDMYCGIGTISLFLSRKAKEVFGVEIVPQAIEDANRNADLNEITNAKFFVGKAEEIVPQIYSRNEAGSHADVVVVDPPRKGLDEKLLKTLAMMSPKRLVYVSCDPATLGRDLKYLTGEGFKLERVAVFDQFSHSTHVESVCLLSRKAFIDKQ